MDPSTHAEDQRPCAAAQVVIRPPFPPLGGSSALFSGGLKPRLNAPPADDITKGTFIAKNFTCPLESSWKKSPVDRIRDIDFVTMYKPSQDECDELNLTGDKLSLKSQYALILLSGGCKGCRFSSDDINSFLQLSKEIHTAHVEVTTTLDKLDSNSKKSRLKSFPASADDDPRLVEYHETCDRYMCVLLRLQTLIKEKQQSLTSGEKLERGDNDSKVGRPVPKFLSVLMERYKSMQTKSADLNNYLKRPTIGKLSTFLSCCVVGLIAVEDTEMADALDELIEASNDTEYSYIYAQQEAQAAAGSFSYSCLLRSASEERRIVKTSSLSKEYIAKRLFCFLSKLTEVKSYVMDEKSLYCFDFLPLMNPNAN